MQSPAPRLATKMSKRETWGLGMPGKAAPVELSAKEQSFLSYYSEHGNRLLALEQAGLKQQRNTGSAQADHLAGALLDEDSDSAQDQAQQDLAQANAILAKISLLPMGDVVSAIGGDKILYLAGLLTAFKSPDELHIPRMSATQSMGRLPLSPREGGSGPLLVTFATAPQHVSSLGIL